MIGAILGFLGPAIDRFFDSKDDAERLKSEISKVLIQNESTLMQAQIDLNKVEAQSKSLFVAGWRPFVGWVCASALAYNFILQPLLTWCYVAFVGADPNFPTLDIGPLMTILGGLLGIGAMRSYDKKNKVSTERI